MRFRHGLLTGLLAIALGGCASQPAKPVEPPKVVQVVVTRYVPLPDKYLQDCPKATPKNKTVAEAVRVARARGESLDDCNTDKRTLREINGKAVPGQVVTDASLP